MHFMGVFSRQIAVDDLNYAIAQLESPLIKDMHRQLVVHGEGSERDRKIYESWLSQYFGQAFGALNSLDQRASPQERRDLEIKRRILRDHSKYLRGKLAESQWLVRHSYNKQLLCRPSQEQADFGIELSKAGVADELELLNGERLKLLDYGKSTVRLPGDEAFIKDMAWYFRPDTEELYSAGAGVRKTVHKARPSFTERPLVKKLFGTKVKRLAALGIASGVTATAAGFYYWPFPPWFPITPGVPGTVIGEIILHGYKDHPFFNAGDYYIIVQRDIENPNSDLYVVYYSPKDFNTKKLEREIDIFDYVKAPAKPAMPFNRTRLVIESGEYEEEKDFIFTEATREPIIENKNEIKISGIVTGHHYDYDGKLESIEIWADGKGVKLPSMDYHIKNPRITGTYRGWFGEREIKVDKGDRITVEGKLVPLETGMTASFAIDENRQVVYSSVNFYIAKRDIMIKDIRKPRIEKGNYEIFKRRNDYVVDDIEGIRRAIYPDPAYPESILLETPELGLINVSLPFEDKEQLSRRLWRAKEVELQVIRRAIASNHKDIERGVARIIYDITK
jgi:hypothetical protein